MIHSDLRFQGDFNSGLSAIWSGAMRVGNFPNMGLGYVSTVT